VLGVVDQAPSANGGEQCDGPEGLQALLASHYSDPAVIGVNGYAQTRGDGERGGATIASWPRSGSSALIASDQVSWASGSAS
jgi:hypothetical protein